MEDLINIALADDKYIYRIGFKREIKRYAKIRLLYEAEDGSDLIDILKKRVRPDIILMDLIMPKVNGIEATRYVRDNYPSILVAGISENGNNPYVDDFIEAGGNAFLSKENLHIDLNYALSELLLKGYYFNNYFPQDHVSEILNLTGKKLFFRDGKRFTDKEILVMHWLSKHYTTNEIAEELKISRESIKKYKSSILSKIQASSDTEIMAYAMRHGYSQEITSNT